jgi:ribonuclease BN (tRNA processing enzyme)
LVETAGQAWLVDGGSGTLQRCARAGVDPRRLAGGFYSHYHPDHCADLVPLLFAMRVGPEPRTTDYPIVAGEGFRSFFDGLTRAYGKWIQPGQRSVLIEELPLDRPGHVDRGALQVHSRPARHAAGALHLRFEADGISVVFSGDTAASEELAVLAAGADLLVCECAGSDPEPVPGHLRPAEVAAIVDAARPREVWLTHLYPHVDPALAVATVAATGVPTRHAHDGLCYGTPSQSAVSADRASTKARTASSKVG